MGKTLRKSWVKRECWLSFECCDREKWNKFFGQRGWIFYKRGKKICK